MVVLYSSHCPKCHVIEKKLAQNGVNFEIVDDIDKVVAFGEANNITSAPILDVDGQVMDFMAANKWLNK